MTKEELINLTLRELKKSLIENPERFDLECHELNPQKSAQSEAVIWKNKKAPDGTTEVDPNMTPKTVILTFNKSSKEMSCYIFFRDFTNISSIASYNSDAATTITFGSLPLIFYSTYRSYMVLRNKVMDLMVEKENNTYVDKLNKIFPGTFEEELLGKE